MALQCTASLFLENPSSILANFDQGLVVAVVPFFLDTAAAKNQPTTAKRGNMMEPRSIRERSGGRRRAAAALMTGRT